MRSLWKNLGIALAVVALCALAWFELVADWRTPRSDFSAGRVLGTNVSMSLVTFGALTKEMKEKYGPLTRVSLNAGNGRVRVERDGQLLHEETMAQKISSVIGMFAVGRRDGSMDKVFPFEISPHENRKLSGRAVASAVRNRFAKSGAQRWLNFADQDFSVDRCVQLPEGLGIGGAGKLLRLRQGTVCIVTWRRSQPPTSMLVSVSLADGDPWMRPFSRRICRTITEAALTQVEGAERERLAFAGCVLIDRPGRVGATETLTSYSYSVGPGDRLALMD